MPTILLTGFEPFGGDARNPSADAVSEVAARWDGPAVLVTDILPVAFEAAGERVRSLIDEHEPDLVVAAGLAGGRTHVTPERVAINLCDARIPDNAGARPVDEPCVPGAPAAYFATLPVKAIAHAIGGPVSHTAGTFVCNHVMFVALDEASRRPGARAGFIHVPWSDETAPAGAPSLPAAEIAGALDVALRTSLARQADLREPAGTTH